MTRQRRINPVLLDYIRDAAQNLGAKAIRADIARQPDLAALGVPSLRTVQDIVAEQRVAEPVTATGWSPLDTSPVVLGALRAAADKLGHWPTVTRAQADILAAILRVAPTCPGAEAYRLARRGADPRLAQYLAYAPWQDDGEAYVRAHERGIVPRVILSEYTLSAYRRANEKRAASRSQPPASDGDDGTYETHKRRSGGAEPRVGTCAPRRSPRRQEALRAEEARRNGR